MVGVSDELRSRVFRQVVTIEVITMVGAEAELRDPDAPPDKLLLGAGVDVDGLVRGAVHEADSGPGVWVVAGESTAGPVEELTAAD